MSDWYGDDFPESDHQGQTLTLKGASLPTVFGAVIIFLLEYSLLVLLSPKAQ